jgi:hypothetical protein
MASLQSGQARGGTLTAALSCSGKLFSKLSNKAGERTDHFETVRRRKDGSLMDLLLTISPVRDGTGVVIGAFKEF